jgi:predicted phosphodiesterase
MKKPTLIIADTHIPFEKEGYLEFCKEQEKRFNCGRVVHIGDLVDNHAISYHEHDPDGWSPEEEMRVADKVLVKWFKAFPELYLCLGNHDRLPDRKGKTVGLPSRCFKDFREMWKLPKNWHIDFQWIFDGVLYKHGLNCGGKGGHINAAIIERQSCVIGHNHVWAGVEWDASPKDCIFGMAVGCGIDKSAYAFAYGRDLKKKPILGCGIVFSDTNAQYVPMNL